MSGRRRIRIRELKNQASRIVDEVREKEEPYVVTKRGEPVAVLRPWSAEDTRRAEIEQVEKGLDSLSRLAGRVARAAGRRRRRGCFRSTALAAMAVLDASVWVSLCHARDRHHDKSERWIRERLHSGERFAAPTLLRVEVAAAIRRLTADAELARAAVLEIDECGWSTSSS